MIKMDNYFSFLVRGFIVNLVSSINEPRCFDYHKVHVRGTCFDFFPAFINSYLDRPADKSSYMAPSIGEIVLELAGGIHKA